MLPSRGLTRARGLVLQNQILSRAPVRSITRQTAPTSRPAIASTRQFGTSLRSNASPFPRPATVGLLSGARIGAAGILSSQAILSSPARRFASTESAGPTSPDAPTPSSEFPTDFSDFPDLDASSLMDIPEKVGYLSNLGLDFGIGPASLLKFVLEHLHFTAGLPWWAAIVGMGVIVRGAMVYPALIGQQESLKSREMREDPLYKDTQAKFMLAMTRGAQSTEMLELRMQMKLLQENAGVKTWKLFLPMLIQLPVIFGGMRLMRTMAALPVPGLDSAGVLWFTDLTVPDPLYILPLLSAVLAVLGFRRAAPFMTQQQAEMMKWMPWVIGPIGLVVTMNLQATVQLFLFLMAVGQYVQTAMFSVPLVRRWCGLPPLEALMVNPAAQQIRASPFSAPGGMQYQAPRTIKTTATETTAGKTTGAGGAPVSDPNPFTYFKSIMDNIKQAQGTVSDKFSEYKESANTKKEIKSLADYEKRKAMDDSKKYQARKAKELSKREQRSRKSEKK